MKNITLSADEELIERARAVARSQHTTLNAAFREWLRQYSGRVEAAARYDALMKSFSHINSGRKFTREEMNER
jgi:predicted transcriptional regulator